MDADALEALAASEVELARLEREASALEDRYASAVAEVRHERVRDTRQQHFLERGDIYTRSRGEKASPFTSGAGRKR